MGPDVIKRLGGGGGEKEAGGRRAQRPGGPPSVGGGGGAAALQQPEHGAALVELGHVVGGVAPLVLVAHLAGRALQQELHHRHVALLRGQVQGQVALGILDVNVGFKLQQSLQSVQKTRSGYVVNHGEAGTVFQVGVRTAHEQPPGNFGIAEFHYLGEKKER